MAGADVRSLAVIDDASRQAVRSAIDAAFVSAFRLVMMCAAGLAILAAAIGSAIR
jgi:hypothetical protein